jgi:DNA/RNA-binding domain of Phe-tRNA-synthetase-like protein
VSAEPAECLVEAEVAGELPGLRLWSLDLPAGDGPSPPELKHRMGDMSSRFLGSHAVALRSKPIPHAYRVFFRHIGLDPDVRRTPVEKAAVDRLLAGEFRSRGLVDDALLIAVVETGVPVWALDAEAVDGPLGVRTTVAGETFGRGPDGPPVTPGRLAVADAEAPLAILFGEIAPGHGVRGETRRMTLFAVRVDGVPAIHVEESLWTCAGVLGAR